MLSTVDNRGERDYAGKVSRIAQKLREWQGPIVVIAHVDPDGDALGSTLALKRALEAMGKGPVLLPMEPPRFLEFLAGPDELSAPLEALPDGALLAVLDVADETRAEGAPLEGAEFVINVDHHGTNSRFGDLALVEPGKAATALMVKEIVEAMGVTWTVPIATPCLTGILTDTGNFRYANTDTEALRAASELIATGLDYAYLADRLQWRHRDYFRMLGMVMNTVEFPLDGKVVVAGVTEEMRERVGESEDDSDDYVGLIRYAEGSKVAVFLKEREGHTKVSVRTRDGVSAQAICVELGGGGHVSAAGAKIEGPLAVARAKVLEAAARELERCGAI
ncbi:MAG TPA: bifunctional oligoribonuclease/PAP phosphatase NrnA [Trueperaceae bacterium]